MSSKTITLSAVECRFRDYYRVNQSTGASTYYKTFLLCPTAIAAPGSINGFTYDLSLTCIDSADSSVSYSFSGDNSDGFLGFTIMDPTYPLEWNEPNEFPTTIPDEGTCYIAIEESELSLGSDYVTYQLSGSVTFIYTQYLTYNASSSATNMEFTAKLVPGGGDLVNKLRIGTTTPKNYYCGSSVVKQIYLGNTLLYGEGGASGYAITVYKLSSPVTMELSQYDGVSINGVNLTTTEKKVASTQLTVQVTSGAVIMAKVIDIYAYIDPSDTSRIIVFARNDAAKCDKNTKVKAT